MKVTLLGTGSALPSGTRVQSGTLVEVDDSRVLIDCGSGVLHRIGAMDGVGVLDVTTVVLTHHHLDHVSDLSGLLKARYLLDDPTLTIVGPPGTREVCDALFTIDDMAQRTDITIDEREATDAPFTLEGIQLRAAEGTHGKQSISYRLADAVTVCGDTAVDPDVLSLADGCHTLVHECSYPDGVETDTHSTPGALASQLADIDVEQIYLTHLFPEAEPVAERTAATVAEATDATVRIGADLTTFEVPS